MASARARLGGARRGIIGRQKKTDVLSGILGTAGTVAAFAGTQAKKAKTAWGEYEAGMEAKFGQEGKLAAGLEHESRKAGGRGLVGIGRRALQTLIPGGDKGWFQGPTGEVRIGGSMYDRGQIQKVGGVLGSDIGATLSEGARKSYMERTAPGTKAPGSIEGFDYSSLKGSGLSPEQYDIKVAQEAARTKEYEANEALASKKQVMGGGTYRGPGGQIVDPNPYADLEKAYGDTRGPGGHPGLGSIPSSIGYGQKEHQAWQWEQNKIPWAQQVKERQTKELMQEGVQQNPYMPGSPWLPGKDENPYKSLQQTYEDQWK